MRKLKATDKSVLSDGKTLGGKGRLTEKRINTSQCYFGNAMRQGAGTTVYQLKKNIGAVLYHCSEAPTVELRHQMCPRTDISWCKYQADQINGTSNYKYKPGIPIVIRDKIIPIFKELSNDSLLRKCLHGKTQNNNESINGVIWKRCPKDVFVGRNTLEIAVASAVISFNDGVFGILRVLDLLDISPGKYSLKFCNAKDTKRVVEMNRKSTAAVKQMRKQLRAHRKGYADVIEEKEGVVYGAGLF